MPGRPSGPERGAPPRILDPILSAWEAADRRRRGIRPLRDEGILGIEQTRHRGQAIELRGGTILRPGDRVGEIHLRNDRVRELEQRAGVAAAFREARADMRALAAAEASLPAAGRLAACHGAGIVARFAAREGWEIRPRRRTAWQRVEDWYFRWLLVRWSPAGRERLRHGRGPLRSVDAWLTAGELSRRYGDGGASD